MNVEINRTDIPVNGGYGDAFGEFKFIPAVAERKSDQQKAVELRETLGKRAGMKTIDFMPEVRTATGEMRRVTMVEYLDILETPASYSPDQAHA